MNLKTFIINFTTPCRWRDYATLFLWAKSWDTGKCLKSCRPPAPNTSREFFLKGTPPGNEGGQASWMVFQVLGSWIWLLDLTVLDLAGVWPIRFAHWGTDPASLTLWDMGCSTHHPKTQSHQKDIWQCNAVTGRWGLLSLLLKPEKW